MTQKSLAPRLTRRPAGDINRLVEQVTDGMITEILDQIPELAVMYLVNAVAFDAEWETPYDESQIQDAVFYAEDGSGPGGFHDVRYHVPLSDHGTCPRAFVGLTRRAMTLWRCFRRRDCH